MSTGEVAASPGKDVRTVHRMVESGELTPVAKMPGRTGAYLFDPKSVEPETDVRQETVETRANPIQQGPGAT